MLDAGVIVTINSDDPAYVGGYLNDNYIAIQQALSLSRDDIFLLLKNSFMASFLPQEKKEYWINALDSLY